ncbi:MAG: hypothetical protein LKK00_09350 [Intestinimonas sp.]|nr:hypothetical protein [Intestinimonas sp.]
MQKMAEARQAGQDYLNTFPEGSVEQKVAGGVLSLGQSAAYLPLGVLGPAAPAAAMGADAAAGKLYDSTAQGEGADRALTRGLGSGAISAVTNYLPVKNVLNLVKTGGASVVKNLLEQAGVQAGQEATDYALNYLADRAAKDPNATFSVKELADNALSGAGTGLVFGAAGTVIGGALNGIKAASRPVSDQYDRVKTSESHDIKVEDPTQTSDSESRLVQPGATSAPINENGLSAYSELERTNLSSGKKNKLISTVQDAVSFIRNALSDKKNVDKAYLGKVPDGTAQKVMENTGLDVTGYNAVLPSDSVRHIFNHHGDPIIETARGQVPVSAETVAHIPEILSDPDTVHLSDKTDRMGRKTIILGKTIGDRYVTVQAVTDGKKTLTTDTLYIIKKNSQDTMSNAGSAPDPAHNARSVPPQSSSLTYSMPQTDGKFKGEVLTGQKSAAQSESSSGDKFIDDRTYNDVSSRKVHAFQFDHPELHEYFARAASDLLYDLDRGQKGERNFAWDESGNLNVTGQKRNVTEPIERLLDNANISYQSIKKALYDIIHNNGQENYAAAKKVELVLDDVLTNGYAQDSDGYPVEPDANYIQAKNLIRESGTQPGTDGLGAMNNPHAQDVSKVVTNTLQKSNIFSDAEKQMKMLSAEDNTYDIITEKQSMAEAQSRLANDFAGEEADLPEKNDWTSADLDTAMGILSQKTQEARQSGDYSEVDKWAKSIREHGTRAGQMTQAFAKYSRTPEGTVVDAEQQLSDTKLSDTQKNKVMSDVQSQLNAMESAGDDPASLIQVIKDSSAIRRTGAFFSNKLSGSLEKALNVLTPEELKNIALSQIQSIPTDYQPRTQGQKIRSVRSMLLLSNLATVHRNIAGNLSFDLIDAVSTAPSTALDTLLSKATRTRSTTVDPSWISKEKWTASAHAGLRSYAESALDVDTQNLESRYGLSSKRTFKMTGGPIDRFFSTWEKYTSYALNVPDEFQKGGIEATVQSGVNRLKERGLVKDDTLDTRGQEVAKYRTFQDNTRLSAASMGIHDLGNLWGIGTSNGKKIHNMPVKDMGEGDFVNPFPRVPANLVSRALEYSPAGLTKGAVEVANVLKNAKAGTLTAARQAQAVADVGRGLTGSGFIAIFTAAAAANLLRVAPDTEDKNVSALNASEGVTGTQLNTDALARWASGGSAEWKSGDTLVSVGFLEPLNAMMATGALVAQAAQEDGEITAKNVLKSSFSGTVQSLLELPAMSSITDIENGFQYSDADTTGGRMVDAAKQFAAGQVSSSTIPNSVRAVARGLDPYYRNQYSSGTTAGRTVDSIKAAIPGLRETLPATQTPFGQPKEYGNSGGLNLANATILPGSVTTYRPSAVSDEIRNLSEQTGATSLYPDRKAASSIRYDSQKYELTPAEQDQYHEIYGKAAHDAMQGLMKFSGYDNLSTDEKADAMTKALTYASDLAKQQILSKRGVEYESSLLKGSGGKTGDPLYEYLAYKVIYNSLGDGLSKQGRVDAITDSKYGFSDSTLYSTLTDSQKETYDNKVKGKVGLDVYMDVAAYAGSVNKNKSKVMDYISKQKISGLAKDALYFAMGYKESTLYKDAPWH